MNKKILYLIALAVALAAPFFAYPVFLMKLLCFALFACAFNLLIGFTGLLSFGHAAFFGSAGYVTGHLLTVVGLPTELGIVCGVRRPRRSPARWQAGPSTLSARKGPPGGPGGRSP